MNKTTSLQTSFAAVALCALSMTAAHAASITKVEYETGKTRISADYKVDKAACSAKAGNAKDICIEESKAKEKIAFAELEYAYTGKAKDAHKASVAKVEAAYSVAKEKCEDKSGNVKDVCVKEAKAVQAKALADLKMGKDIVEAHKEASQDKTDADYKVALEKCDALSGDPKTACVTAAKTKFGKN